jgi:microcystin-dependent protein
MDSEDLEETGGSQARQYMQPGATMPFIVAPEAPQ